VAEGSEVIQELAIAIQTPQALFLAVISLLDHPVESFPVAAVLRLTWQ